jgi:hypothetical protein
VRARTREQPEVRAPVRADVCVHDSGLGFTGRPDADRRSPNQLTEVDAGFLWAEYEAAYDLELGTLQSLHQSGSANVARTPEDQSIGLFDQEAPPALSSYAAAVVDM